MVVNTSLETTKQTISKKRLLSIFSGIFLIAILAGSIGYTIAAGWTPASVNLALDDLPTDFTAAIKTDGTNYWAILKNGTSPANTWTTNKTLSIINTWNAVTGTVVLNGFRLPYGLTIPSTVTVVEKYGQGYPDRVFVQTSNVGSPYTISVDTTTGTTYYMAQDASNAYVNEWSSTVWATVMQNCINIGGHSTIFVQPMNVTTYLPVNVNQSHINIKAEPNTVFLNMPSSTNISLTADVDVGDTIIALADTTQFRVGQYIIYTDSYHYPTNNGWENCGPTYLITSVDATSVTISEPVKTNNLASVIYGACAIPEYNFFFVNNTEGVSINGFNMNGNFQNRAKIQGAMPGYTADPVAHWAGSAIDVYQSKQSTIVNNYIANMDLHGVCIDNNAGSLFNSVDCVVKNNYITNPFNIPVLLLGVQNCTVSDNFLSNALLEDGVYLWNASGCHVKDNTISNIKRYGIFATSTVNHCEFSGNSIIGFTFAGPSYGINIATACNDNLVHDNYIYGFNDGIVYYQSGTGNMIYNNRIVNVAYGIVSVRTNYLAISGNTITQASVHAIECSSSNYTSIEYNTLWNQALTVINSINTIIRYNNGFATENSGSQGNTTATTVVISHGLAGTPNAGIAASFNDTGITSYTITGLTSTQITFTVQGTPTGAFTCYWSAIYKP